MLKKYFACSISFIMMSQYILFAAPKPHNLNEYSPSNAVIRSCIYPGWGQYFNGQKTKAYIIGSLFGASLIYTCLMYTKSNNTYDDYDNLGIKNSSLYSDYEAQSNQARDASYVAVGLWIYSVLDALIKSNNVIAANNEALIKKENIKLACEKDNIKLVYQRKF